MVSSYPRTKETSQAKCMLIFKFIHGEEDPTQASSSVIMKSDGFIPLWLPPMLKACYSGSCANHINETKNGNNFFCIDCRANAFCFNCSSNHKEHQILQIRRSAPSHAIRVDDIKNHINISGIQSYLLNNAKVLFLNERPHVGKGVKETTSTSFCGICKRSLSDASNFCSLGCKVEAVKRGFPEVTFCGSDRGEDSRNNACCSTPPTCDPISVLKVKSHRRKGIPGRAPFM